MGLAYYNGIKKLHENKEEGVPSDTTEYVVWSTLPLFCGTAIYSLEGILMSLPTAASMREWMPRHIVVIGLTRSAIVIGCRPL